MCISSSRTQKRAPIRTKECPKKPDRNSPPFFAMFCLGYDPRRAQVGEDDLSWMPIEHVCQASRSIRTGLE